MKYVYNIKHTLSCINRKNTEVQRKMITLSKIMVNFNSLFIVLNCLGYFIVRMY